MLEIARVISRKEKQEFFFVVKIDKVVRVEWKKECKWRRVDGREVIEKK